MRLGSLSIGRKKGRRTRGAETAGKYPDWALRYGFMMQRGADGLSMMYERIVWQMETGLPVRAAVKKLAHQALKRSSSDPEALILMDIAQHLHAGDSFAQATRKWVSITDNALFAAGDESGRLVESLQMAIRLSRMRRRLIRAAIGGLFQPLILLLVLYGLLWFMGSKSFAAVLSNVNVAQAGPLAGMVVGASHFAHTPLFLVGPLIFAALLVVALWSLPWLTGPFRRVLEFLPPWSFYKHLQGAVWLASYAALISAGMSERNALLKLMSNGTRWLNQRLDSMKRGLVAGLSAGVALEESGYDFPSREIVDNMVILSNNSNYASLLVKLSERGEAKAEAKIKLATTMTVVLANVLINLFVILLVGGIAGILGASGGSAGL